MWSPAIRYIRVYKYTKIQGPRFHRNYIIARDQKSDLHGLSFQSSPKINRMLIIRPFASISFPEAAILLVPVARSVGQSNADSGNEIAFAYNESSQHPNNAGLLTVSFPFFPTPQ